MLVQLAMWNGGRRIKSLLLCRGYDEPFNQKGDIQRLMNMMLKYMLLVSHICILSHNIYCFFGYSLCSLINL